MIKDIATKTITKTKQQQNKQKKHKQQQGRIIKLLAWGSHRNLQPQHFHIFDLQLSELVFVFVLLVASSCYCMCVCCYTYMFWYVCVGMFAFGGCLVFLFSYRQGNHRISRDWYDTSNQWLTLLYQSRDIEMRFVISMRARNIKLLTWVSPRHWPAERFRAFRSLLIQVYIYIYPKAHSAEPPPCQGAIRFQRSTSLWRAGLTFGPCFLCFRTDS